MELNRCFVTGWRECGKTTFCREMLRAARCAGWNTAGLISPAEFRHGVKELIWAQNVQNDERRLLASLHPGSGADMSLGKWFFCQDTIDWGNQVLQSAVPCDLLIVDELGPLEFNLASGWVSALDVIQSGQFQLAMVVIRPDLIDTARDLFGPAQVIEIEHISEVHAKVLQCAPYLIQNK